MNTSQMLHRLLCAHLTHHCSALVQWYSRSKFSILVHLLSYVKSLLVNIKSGIQQFKSIQSAGKHLLLKHFSTTQIYVWFNPPTSDRMMNTEKHHFSITLPPIVPNGRTNCVWAMPSHFCTKMVKIMIYWAIWCKYLLYHCILLKSVILNSDTVVLMNTLLSRWISC